MESTLKTLLKKKKKIELQLMQTNIAIDLARQQQTIICSNCNHEEQIQYLDLFITKLFIKSEYRVLCNNCGMYNLLLFDDDNIFNSTAESQFIKQYQILFNLNKIMLPDDENRKENSCNNYYIDENHVKFNIIGKN